MENITFFLKESLSNTFSSEAAGCKAASSEAGANEVPCEVEANEVACEVVTNEAVTNEVVANEVVANEVACEAEICINYACNYNIKSLIQILNYYGINKSKMLKDEMIQVLIFYETDPANREIVERRMRLWQNISELKNDAYFGKYILFNVI